MSIHSLPTDVAKHMLSFSTPIDLVQNVAKTSKSLKTLSEDDILWKKIAEKHGIAIPKDTSPKQAVLGKYAELNEVFAKSVNYVTDAIRDRHLPFLGAIKIPALSPLPVGTDPLDQYAKNLEWCTKELEASAKSKLTITPKHSLCLTLISNFNDLYSLREIAEKNWPLPPKEIYDPRLLQIFAEASPKVLPAHISFGSSLRKYQDYLQRF